MTFLPIVGRELRVAARRLSTYWIRVVMAAGASFIGGCILLFSLNVPPQKVGYFIFVGLAGLSMLFCLFYGRQATADCLSSEKREGTLGLLFLTDLKGHDVVLGKLAATSMGGFYGLLAVFPVLAIPILLGGITSGEFWRIVLVLVNTFLFSLSVGIMVSSLCWDSRRAIAGNFLVLLFLVGIPPAVASVVAASKSTPPNTQFFLSCPIYTFYLSLAGPYRAHGPDFWKSLGLVHALTWLLVGLASVITPHQWRDRPVQSTKRSWKARWRALSYGSAAGQEAFRKEALDVNAFYWLAARARLKPVHVWIFLGAIGVWWLIGWATAGRIWFDNVAYVITALLLNTTLKIWLMIEASQRLAEDHQAGALELLLSTPLTVRDILRGQWLALRRQFARPLGVVLVIELLLLLPAWIGSKDPQTIPIWLAGMFMLVADLAASGWVAMWLALKARNPHQATLGTMVRILVLPWIFVGMVIGGVGIWFTMGLGRSWEPSWKLYLSLWFGAGLVADLWFGAYARWRLLRSFRELAQQRSTPAAAQEPGLGRQKHVAKVQSPVQQDRKKRQPLASANGIIARHKKAAFALGLGCVFVFLGMLGLLPGSRPSFPPPATISVNHSNFPLRVFRGDPGLFILPPDNSLWQWGHVSTVPSSNQPILAQVGTNYGWVKVLNTHSYCLGLQTNGTLWHWPKNGSGASIVPAPFDLDRDWIDVATLPSGTYAVALRRDGTLWEWGSILPGAKASSLTLARSPPSQIGTDDNWTAVSANLMCIMGLRKDHTLWVWGMVYAFGPGGMAISRQTRLAAPAQVCQETNWLGFLDSWPVLAQTSSGDAWELSGLTISADAPVEAACGRLAASAPFGRFTVAYCEGRKAYEIRQDGTLWERDCPAGVATPSSVGPWRRFDRRSDWVALYPAGPTGLGLTADGTLWLWGYDPSQAPSANLGATFRVIQARIAALFSGSPTRLGAAQTPFIQTKPRAIIRMVPPPLQPPDR